MDQLHLNFDEPATPYQVRRSRRRRTLAVSIDVDQGVVVYSPYRLAQTEIDAFLKQKQQWISDKLAQVQAQREHRPRVRWEAGAQLPYRGGTLALDIVPGATRERMVLLGDTLRMEWRGNGTPPPAEAARLAARWYREQARQEIHDRVLHFQAQLAVRPRRVTVKNQKRRWGTCTSRGALYFNWRLILAPPAVLDYVVVHELCHLRELNHSPRFWQLVHTVLPDAAARKTWLRQHGMTLELDL